MRADGAPCRVAVARVMAYGWRRPPSTASLSHRANCRIGSGARSCSSSRRPALPREMLVIDDHIPKPLALIFDLDGTLVDTVENRIRAWLETFRELQIPA